MPPQFMHQVNHLPDVVLHVSRALHDYRETIPGVSAHP